MTTVVFRRSSSLHGFLTRTSWFPSSSSPLPLSSIAYHQSRLLWTRNLGLAAPVLSRLHGTALRTSVPNQKDVARAAARSIICHFSSTTSDKSIKDKKVDSPEASSSTEFLMDKDDNHSADSSSLRNNVNDDDDVSDTASTVLLYERSALFWPRVAVYGSSAHTLYWIWYCVDFIPTMNAGPIAQFHIAPFFGAVGLGTAAFFSAVSLWYPKRLISRVEQRQKNQQQVGVSGKSSKHNNNSSSNSEIVIYTHNLLPWVRPSTTPEKLSSPLRLQVTNTIDLNKILGELKGDLTAFKGHLAIQVGNRLPWWNYILEIAKPEDVYDNDLLLDALVVTKSNTKMNTPMMGGDGGDTQFSSPASMGNDNSSSTATTATTASLLASQKRKIKRGGGSRRRPRRISTSAAAARNRNK